MKSLLVMRHAKSDWNAAFGSDHERPLSYRGVKAARRMGRFITDAGTVPQLVLSSTAVRARTTAELAAEAGDWGCAIVTSTDLYASDPGQVIGAVHEIENGVENLLVAGHEPTWSTLIGWLIGGARVRMPTAAVACLDYPHGDWTDLAPGSCVLRWFVTPKMLKGK